nr:hypothetical protein [Tanacetum cinerariifolium]
MESLSPQPVAPTTDEQRLVRKNELKARGTLLMALLGKHQLKFNIHKDAKTLMEAIKKRLQKLISQLEILGESLSQEDINLKFLRSLFAEWRTHTLIWRNKTDLEDQTLDDLFNSLKIYEAEVTNRGLRKIAEIDADEDVILEEVAAKDADDDEAEPAELKEVIEVVTTSKLMTEVVTVATTITAASSAARRRKDVVIRDPEETATPLVIVYSKPKSKDKGKGILVEELKSLKKQAQIEQDEAYARELEAELNANINWKEVMEQVKKKENQDNTVLRYQALKRKPQIEAQARKNIMVYLKNMVGFKMDFFKGMSYDDIRIIFEKHFNSIVAFLEKGEEKLEEEASKVIKRKSETFKEKAAKKHKLDEEVKELKTHLQIIPPDEDDVYTEATPLTLKVPVVDYQIHTEHNKPYYKIIRADGTHQLFIYGLAKVKSRKLLESCGVHIITFTTTQMILLVERRYHLTRFTLYQMLNNVRLEVEEESKASLELLRFVKRHQQEGYKPE